MHDLRMHAPARDRITHLLATHAREPFAFYKIIDKTCRKKNKIAEITVIPFRKCIVFVSLEIAQLK